MPSADVITVDFAALRAAADSLSTKANTLVSTMDNLQGSLAPIKATWYASGSSAGEAANQSETRLRAAIADVIDTIAKFSAKTSEAHDMQVALENKNTSMFA